LLTVAFGAGAVEYAGAFLELGAGPRAVGLGQAQVAVADDAYATAWNPAGLMAIREMDFNAAFTSYFGLVNNKVFNYAHVYDRGVLAFSYLSTWVDEINSTTYTDNRPLLAGDDFSYNASLMTLSKADRWGDNAAWGVSAKFFGEGFSERPGASGVGLDIGFQQKISESIQWGMAAQNLVKTSLDWDTPSKAVELLPTIYTVGVAIRLFPQLTWTTDLRFKDSRPGTAHTGVEYLITNPSQDAVSYAFRAGLDNGRLNIGLGLVQNSFKLDYAYQTSPHQFLDATHLVSIGFGR